MALGRWDKNVRRDERARSARQEPSSSARCQSPVRDCAAWDLSAPCRLLGFARASRRGGRGGGARESSGAQRSTALSSSTAAQQSRAPEQQSRAEHEDDGHAQTSKRRKRRCRQRPYALGWALSHAVVARSRAAALQHAEHSAALASRWPPGWRRRGVDAVDSGVEYAVGGPALALSGSLSRRSTGQVQPRRPEFAAPGSDLNTHSHHANQPTTRTTTNHGLGGTRWHKQNKIKGTW